MGSRGKGGQRVAGSGVGNLGVGKAWGSVHALSGGGREGVGRGVGA